MSRNLSGIHVQSITYKIGSQLAARTEAAVARVGVLGTV